MIMMWISANLHDRAIQYEEIIFMLPETRVIIIWQWLLVVSHDASVMQA